MFVAKGPRHDVVRKILWREVFHLSNFMIFSYFFSSSFGHIFLLPLVVMSLVFSNLILFLSLRSYFCRKFQIYVAHCTHNNEDEIVNWNSLSLYVYGSHVSRDREHEMGNLKRWKKLWKLTKVPSSLTRSLSTRMNVLLSLDSSSSLSHSR